MVQKISKQMLYIKNSYIASKIFGLWDSWKEEKCWRFFHKITKISNCLFFNLIIINLMYYKCLLVQRYYWNLGSNDKCDHFYLLRNITVCTSNKCRYVFVKGNIFLIGEAGSAAS